MKFFVLNIILILCISCNQSEHKLSHDMKPHSTMNLSYAERFCVNYYKSYKEIIVFAANKKDTLQHYTLYLEEDTLVTPASRMAVLSSVYLSYLAELGLLDKLQAIGEYDYIYSPEIRRIIKSQQIPELGSIEKLNHEALLMADLDMVLTFGWQDYQRELDVMYPNIRFVYAYEYLEEHPLGRAEWIKFVAAFFGLEKEAVRIFSSIQTNYELLKSKTDSLSNRPKILINMPFKEQWHLPGGQSYSARFIRDAGGNYPWSNDISVDSKVLDWEIVYANAYDSDMWINTGAFSSYKEVEEVLPDMRLFDAFKKKQSYNNNARLSSLGANDYWETGLLHVDEVLADLIAIFHPNLLPDRELMYYKALENE